MMAASGCRSARPAPRGRDSPRLEARNGAVMCWQAGDETGGQRLDRVQHNVNGRSSPAAKGCSEAITGVGFRRPAQPLDGIGE